MAETSNLPALPPLEPIVALIQKDMLPLFEKSERAEAALKEHHDYLTELMSEWGGEDNAEINEAVENAMLTLASSKTAYEKWIVVRKNITESLDTLKEQLMVPEKRVASDGKTKNYYTSIKGLLGTIENQKIARVQRQEKEARDRKEKDLAKVDYQVQIKKNLANMVIDRVVKLEEYSKTHFDAATVDTFDEYAKKYSEIKPGLKAELYNNCFTSVIASAKLTAEDVLAACEELKQVETFERYEKGVIDGMMPILNNWRARIPTLKAEKIAIAEAKGAELKILQDAKIKRDQEQEILNQQKIADAKAEANQQINADAELMRMEPEFVEQGTVQELEKTAPKKKIARFNNEKLKVKALAQVIYNCVLSDKFPGFDKKDKDKKNVVEDGFNAYIDPVDWWLKFFAQNCPDVPIEGIEIKEVAKIIVKR